MNGSTIIELTTAVPAILAGLAGLIVAIRTGKAAPAAGAQAAQDHLETSSAAREAIAKVTRSVAKDAVQDAVEAQDLPFRAPTLVPPVPAQKVGGPALVVDPAPAPPDGVA